MGLFDPPPLKPKPRKRPRIKLPASVPPRRFAWLFVAVIFSWVAVIGGGGGILCWVILAGYLSVGWKVIGTLAGIGIGGVVGMLVASAFIGELIRYGIEAGEISIFLNEEKDQYANQANDSSDGIRRSKTQGSDSEV